MQKSASNKIYQRVVRQKEDYLHAQAEHDVAILNYSLSTINVEAAYKSFNQNLEEFMSNNDNVRTWIIEYFTM